MMINYLDYKGMKAITLWRPWSWFIVNGHKRIETRSWAPPEALIGQRIAIHAGHKAVSKEGLSYLYGLANRRGFYVPSIKMLQPGVLVGTVELADIREYSDAESFFKDGLEHLCADPEIFEPVRYGWLLRDPELEESPIPLRGRQGFFDIPEVK